MTHHPVGDLPAGPRQDDVIYQYMAAHVSCEVGIWQTDPREYCMG